MPYTDAQLDYLNEHNHAVLATTRRDGSPQISMVMYAVDGDDILVSIKSYTAKWKNVVRQPRVALLIPDGRRQLVVYGTADAIENDPLRAELTAKVWQAMTGNEVEPESLVATLDEQQRTVLRIRADKALMND